MSGEGRGMGRPRLGSVAGERRFLQKEGGAAGDWLDYDFAVVRAVPHVHLDAHVNVGVVVHSRTTGFLRARALTDPAALHALVRGADAELLSHYLASYEGVACGEERHGPIALAPPSERFHWLTAPRSDVIQCSQVHSGRTRDLDATVDDLFEQYVAGQG